MVAQSIESLKHEYTDKYVVVDASRPELARFRDVVGQVKTVNMSGRALVEFIDYNLNIGWYDIAPEFLKIVDKPLPKEEKPAAKKETKPAVAKSVPAAKPEAAAKPQAAAKPGRPSVAEMLAAARGQGGVPAPAKPAPATPTTKPQATAATKTPGKLSTADILAAARGKAATAPEAKAPVEESPVAKAAPAEKPAPAPAAKAPAAASEKVDRTKMSVAEMIAWCRTHDAK